MLSVKPWQPMAVLQYCAAALFCILLGGLVSGVLHKSGVSGFQELDDLGNLFFGTFSFQGMACAFILIFFSWHKVKWRDGFGFSGPNLKRAVGIALLTFL